MRPTTYKYTTAEALKVAIEMLQHIENGKSYPNMEYYGKLRGIENAAETADYGFPMVPTTFRINGQFHPAIRLGDKTLATPCACEDEDDAATRSKILVDRVKVDMFQRAAKAGYMEVDPTKQS